MGLSALECDGEDEASGGKKSLTPPLEWVCARPIETFYEKVEGRFSIVGSYRITTYLPLNLAICPSYRNVIGLIPIHSTSGSVS